MKIMNNINPLLKKYIDENVLTEYSDNIGGHGIDHIQYVINRCFELIQEFSLKLDSNMVYTIAAYHDIGYKKDPDNHEQVSANLFASDPNIATFFNEEQRKIIYEAIVDHRASLEYEARSEYGKLVSSADREISVDNMLKRSFFYQKDKHAVENPTTDQVIAYSYKKLSSKYGKNGYAKMYFPDKKYQEFIATMEHLTSDFDEFKARELAIVEQEKNLTKKK